MPKTTEKKNRGKFFAVDRWTWGQLCDRGSINQAAAYLLLAQGTGADNRSTSWSATALKKYAGISWDRGKIAIEGLRQHGFLRTGETSTVNKPRYELLSRSEIAQATFEKKQAELNDYERLLLTELRDRRTKRARTNSGTLDRLVARGHVHRQADGTYVVADAPGASSDPDVIWLPNSIVTGTDKSEDSPIRRLRTAGDLWTLRLFVDLYHAQNLRDDGGISPKILQEEYERMLVGEQGLYNVWGFKRKTAWVGWGDTLEAHRTRPTVEGKDKPIWDSIRFFEKQGLITFVAHLWDNECRSGQSHEAEIIHAYGGGAGEPLEVSLGNAACRAALAMVPEFKREKAVREGFRYFAPVPNTFPNVQMIGVARLRYRPHRRRAAPLPAAYDQNERLVRRTVKASAAMDRALSEPWRGDGKCREQDGLDSMS
jgi:hypothetical protein